jgi:hypothetical protein
MNASTSSGESVSKPAVVFASTSVATRAGCRRQKSRAMRPPSESPTRCARSAPKKSSTRARSALKSANASGPS